MSHLSWPKFLVAHKSNFSKTLLYNETLEKPIFKKMLKEISRQRMIILLEF